jgi:hypothetical protein
MDTIANVPRRPETAKPEELFAWLEYAASDLLTRWKELAPALSQIRQEHPVINDGDEETAGIFTENIRMVAALRSAFVDFHQEEKAPYLTLGRKVDVWTNTITGMIDAAVEPLRSALRDFTIRRDRARVFEEKEPVRGIYGSKATVKETWGYEVEDIAKVPKEYLTVDDRMVKAVMADRHPKTRVPRRTIPGIKWVKNQTLAVS